MCIKHLNPTYFRSRPTNNTSQYHNPASHQHQNPQHTSMFSRRTTRSRANPAPTGNTSTRPQPPPPPSQPQSSETNKEPPPKEINEVRDISEIDTFSTKQLKYLLIKNCIDYKGVLEKEELRSRARELWIQVNEKRHRRHTSDERGCGDDSDGIEESQMCKICMEQEINCVLLECGHYLTCVTCGRKLSECPICRQNVVRCVRTFKA